MRLVLVHPAMQCNTRHKRILPLGLLYLAAYIRDRIPGVSIEIIDAHIDNLTPEAVAARIIAAPDTELVGIGFWTPHAPFAYALSDILKRHAPNILIIHGGVHPTIMPEESLLHADVCIMHEGEKPLEALVRAHISKNSWKDIPGVAYMHEGAVKKNPTEPFCANLDELPLPAWDLVAMDKYNTPLHIVGGPRLPIIMSRGCPYNCSFCVSPTMWKRQVRWRSASHVVDEMEAAIRLYGLTQYHFWDDNLLLAPERVEQLCQEIIKRGLQIKWVGLSRAAHVVKNQAVLPLMRKAGCIGIEVGVESADAEALKFMHKQQTTTEVESALTLQAKAGMTPLYTLMAFNPGETITGYYLQTEFLNHALNPKGKTKLYVGQFCTAYPGTLFFTESHQIGKLLANGWADYHHHNIKFLPFSLLRDKPVSTVARLSLRHRFVMLLESFLWRYDAYPDKRNYLNNVIRFVREWKLLTRLFRAADGTQTIEQLADFIGFSEQWEYAERLRAIAFMTMIGGQMGLLESAERLDTVTVQCKEIEFNRRSPNLVYTACKMYDAVCEQINRLIGSN